MADTLLIEARETTCELLSKYSKDKTRRVPVKETTDIIKSVLSKGDDHGWASTVIIAYYGLDWAGVLLSQSHDTIALAKCCTISSYSGDNSGLSFVLWAPDSAKMPDLYSRTGLSSGSIEISVVKLLDGNWEIITDVYFYYEPFDESAQVRSDVAIVSEAEMLLIIDDYVSQGYLLQDDAGCPMEVPLNEYISIDM